MNFVFFTGIENVQEWYLLMKSPILCLVFLYIGFGMNPIIDYTSLATFFFLFRLKLIILLPRIYSLGLHIGLASNEGGKRILVRVSDGDQP